ncbi:MAG: hypothetical protein JWP97_4251 [Labilithrix sp.]|nr:hypothetical protein [Labilithrix sp.]
MRQRPFARSRAACRQVLAGLALAGAGASCASGASVDEHVGQARSAVLRGTASGASDDAVVALAAYHNATLYSLCTATLVAPDLLVTARHCLAVTDPVTVCSAEGAPVKGATVHEEFLAPDLLVYTGAELGDRWMDPSLAAAHGVSIVREDAATTCNRDLAFVVLDHDLPGRFARLRTARPTSAGEPLAVVGYGVTEGGDLSPRRLRRDGVPVLATGPAPLDDPPGSGIGSSELLVGESICAGDSGGPAFAASGALVGVVGRGGNGRDDPADLAVACSDPGAKNVYMQLFAKPDVVAEAFARAGHAPRIEDDRPVAAAGGACEQSFDCTSDACIAGVCAPRCETTACPGSLACGAFEDKLACHDPATLPASARGSGCAAAPGDPPRGLASGVLLVLVAALRLRRSRNEKRRGKVSPAPAFRASQAS